MLMCNDLCDLSCVAVHATKISFCLLAGIQSPKCDSGMIAA